MLLLNPGKYREMETDVLVIGSEASGSRAAIEVHDRGAKSIVVTKGIMGHTAVTLKAVFSVCAAFGFADPRDNPDVHLKDLVIGGRLIANQKLADIYTQEVPERLDELGKWGVPWDKAPDGRYRQVKIYGHTYPRSLSVGFRVGLAWMSMFRDELKKRQVPVLNDFMVISYLLSKDGEIAGCFGLDIPSGEFVLIKAGAVIDATGGPLYLYSFNSGTPESTGDGMAMGWRVGAEMTDMEFVQFFPLGLVKPLSLRGDEGITSLMRTWLFAHLYNKNGERFMTRYAPDRMEFADRDVLSRSVYSEIKAGRAAKNGGVWLSAAHLPDVIIEEMIEEMAPGWKLRGIDLLKHGLDLRTTPVEVAPVVHFFCGGYSVDENWATTVKGLYAAGESVGGIHGANRLPGGALGDTQVGAVRAGRDAAAYVLGIGRKEVVREHLDETTDKLKDLLARKEGIKPAAIRKKIQDLMWDYAGVIRNGPDMEKGLEEVARIREEELSRLHVSVRGSIFNQEFVRAIEVENMLDVAELILRASLYRKESRGNHYRSDYPDSSPEWLKNVKLRPADNGKADVYATPVEVTKIPVQEG